MRLPLSFVARSVWIVKNPVALSATYSDLAFVSGAGWRIWIIVEKEKNDRRTGKMFVVSQIDLPKTLQ